MFSTKRQIYVRSVSALDKINSWWQSHRPTARRLAQLYSALLYNAHLKGFIEGDIYQGRAKYVCVPGLNCYSCPGAAGACPVGALQNALSSSSHRAGWYAGGILLLFGVCLGRTVCGWLCPMGLLQELLHKIPTLKIRKSLFTRALSWLKYVILAVFVMAIPFWYGLKNDLPLPAFCKYICPAGTLEGAVGLLSNPVNASKFSMLGILFTRKFIIMLLIALACVFVYRSFCRFLCPLGAIYGLFNRFALISVKVDGSRCTRCGACVRHCGMDVQRVGDHECISCGQCMEVCTQDAISLKAGKVTLKAPERNHRGETPDTSGRTISRVLWGAALILLCLALWRTNVSDPGREASGYESSAPTGSETGQQLEDFTADCYDGSAFHLADTRGRITFINLWATYCAPCVRELDYFSELYQEHKDEVAILAVHSGFVTDDPVVFTADKDYLIPFTTDTDNHIFEIAGGSSTLPQTIVLNRRGEVVYNKVGSVTPEMLETLYEQADQM